MLPTNMMYLTIQHPTRGCCLIYRSPSAPRKHVSAHSQEVHLLHCAEEPEFSRITQITHAIATSFSLPTLSTTFLSRPSDSHFPFYGFFGLSSRTSVRLFLPREVWGYPRLHLHPAGQKGFCIPRHQAKFCSYRMISPIYPPYSIMCEKSFREISRRCKRVDKQKLDFSDRYLRF